MNTDLHQPLHALHPNHDLIPHLLAIQSHHLLHNLKSLDWITHLQCLTTHPPAHTRKRKRSSPSGPASPANPHPPAHTRTLTRTTINGRLGAYMALSYPWDPSPHPLSLDRPAHGAWRIRSGTDRTHVTSDVRDAVLERATRCAATFGCANVWIDRECVPQEGGPAKEMALQSMDLVYSFSAWPVALLFRPLETAAEVALFGRVMGRRLVVADGGGDVLRGGVDGGATARRALGILRAITEDPWWERAWTFQEDYCAGPKMSLLIPVRERGAWRRKQRFEFWRTGDVPGEMMVSSVEFHKAATRFCLAFLKSGGVSETERQVCQTILRKAGRYSYTILYDGSVGKKDYSRTMTTRILEDVAHRKAKYRADLLPIAANCCQYGVRLDTNSLQNAQTSLAASILALYLLNGEIFKNDPDDIPSGLELESMSVFAYLNAISLDNFVPPLQKGQLTFLKTCRFVDVQLSENGVVTNGWLWKLDRRISSSDPRFRGQQHVSKDGDDWAPEQSPLEVLGAELQLQGYHKLAELLKRNAHFREGESISVGEGEEPTHPSPAELYMQITARNLERCVAEGHTLSLGRMWDGQSEEDDGALPLHTAIFIGERELPRESTTTTDTCRGSDSKNACQKDDGGKSSSPTKERQEVPPEPFLPTYAFTAWSGRSDDSDKNVEESQLDKYVSLEVAMDEERANGIPLLRTKRWLNGLCFFGREAEMDVTFAWPPGLQGRLDKKVEAT